MDIITTLNCHRSIRKYKNKKVDDDLLKMILSAGCRASTTGNMQVYSIINTTDEKIKEELLPVHFGQKMIIQAPHVLTFCADFNRFKQWCYLSDATPGYDNFLSFLTAAIDALLVAQNVAVAAESRGLGICYLGTTIYNAEEIIRILELPKGVVPVTTITLGWPDEEPGLTDRLPVEAVVHEEKYNTNTLERIKQLYQEKESLPENLNFIRENGKKTLAQVFTDVRYKKTDNEFFSERILKVLRMQGFL